MAQLEAFDPELVISLTDANELTALGAATLPDRLARVGIAWYAFPIPDFGTPSPGADWLAISHATHAVLASGGNVLLHCHGGRGRSGMVALRLMIEAGEAPDAALARLRAARPGAVETEAQQDWARAGTIRYSP